MVEIDWGIEVLPMKNFIKPLLDQRCFMVLILES